MRFTSYSWFNICNIPIGCGWGIIIQNGGSTSLEEDPVYRNGSLKFRSLTDLWCQVFGCTTESLCCCSICDVFFAKTKVSNFNMTLWVKQEIFQLSRKVFKSICHLLFTSFCENLILVTFQHAHNNILLLVWFCLYCFREPSISKQFSCSVPK